MGCPGVLITFPFTAAHVVGVRRGPGTLRPKALGSLRPCPGPASEAVEGQQLLETGVRHHSSCVFQIVLFS